MIGERIQSMAFNESDAIKTKTAPDVTKAHGHGKISVRMIKFCTNSVTHPLTLIFQNCIAAGIFATQWKKGNIVCIHKKNEKKKKKKNRSSRPVIFLGKGVLEICNKFTGEHPC